MTPLPRPPGARLTWSLVSLPQSGGRARRLESYPHPQPRHGRAPQHRGRPEGLPGGRRHLRQPRGQGVDHHRRPGARGQTGYCYRGLHEGPENPQPQHDAHPCGAGPHQVFFTRCSNIAFEINMEES